MAPGPLTGAAFSGGVLAFTVQGLLGFLRPAAPLSPGPFFDSAASLSTAENESLVAECRCPCEETSVEQRIAAAGALVDADRPRNTDGQAASSLESEPSAAAVLADSWPWTPHLEHARALWPAWGAGAFVLLDMLIVAAFLARRFGHCTASVRRCREQRQLAALEQQVSSRFPEVKRVVASTGIVASTAGAASQLAAGAQKLAGVFQRAGRELQDSLSEASLAKNLDKDSKAVAELLVAWREVGEAAVVFSEQVLDLGASLRKTASDVSGERSELLAEAGRLQQAYIKAVASSCGWREWLLRRSPAPSAAKSPRQEQFESRLVDIAQTFSGLAAQSEALQQRASSAVSAAEAETRRLAQAVGERMIHLRPSWRGSLAREVPSTYRRAGGGNHVDELIKTMTTAAGRQQLRDAEAAQEARAAAERTVVVSPTSPVLTPHAERLDEGEWRLCGHYEHQVLKIGLRILDRDWSSEDLYRFPPGLFREKHITQLLAGTLRLQSMLGSDVSAAQKDMHKLSLRQLLCLRVRHLDFTPSGCGSNTVTGVGDTHEALLSLVDRLLFQQLGRSAEGALSPGGSLADSDAHRLGREAVLYAAAAAAITCPSWWVWWLTEDCRVFFNPVDFASAAVFPAGGVLEIADHSKRDKYEPTGRLRFLEWRISHIAAEDGLSPAPQREAPPEGAGGPSGPGGAASGCDNPASGAATAGMVSPEMLRGLRSALRRTGAQ